MPDQAAPAEKLPLVGEKDHLGAIKLLMKILIFTIFDMIFT